MPSDHDSSRSPLPADPEYWDALARRIVEDARTPLASYDNDNANAPRRDAWYNVLSREAPWLVAASAVALLLIWMALPNPASPASPGFIERTVAPRETGGSLLGGSAPPSVDELMLAFPPALERDSESEVSP